PNGRYTIDRSWLACHYLPGSRCGYFSRKFLDHFGPKRKKGEPVEERHQNIAASMQRILEDTVIHMVDQLHQTTGMKQLCLAGGVALNCAMNGRLLRETPFDSIYVQPAAGDDGIAIGAAYQLHHRFTGKPRSFVMRDACIGPAHTNDEIRAFLELAKIPYETPDDPERRAAELIADGQIVGWYQGRMEFGPRALGSRSILADPTRPGMKDLINKYVKHREEFRPFAPSCLEEHAHEYFEGCTSSPFMLFVYPVVPDKRDKVPAITHVDGTARVQTVARDVNPRYYRLIEEFERLRGVPMVLNTSFNVMGEPIVNTPADAVRCFFSTGMDALVLGDYVVHKR
ncbi:MAG: carbamoyltransferase, partial [bacterium]|nr:carbamoyltransferase [bacterium]